MINHQNSAYWQVMKPFAISPEEARLASQLSEWQQYKKEKTAKYEPYLSFEEWLRETN